MLCVMPQLLTLREHLGSPPVFGGDCGVHPFSFLCCVVCLCLFAFVLCLVYPKLLLSLHCPFLIVPSVLSSVYFNNTKKYLKPMILIAFSVF